MKRILLFLVAFAAIAATAQNNNPVQQINQNVVYRINGATQNLIIGRDTVIRPRDSAYAFVALKQSGDSIALFAFDSTVSKKWRRISGNVGGGTGGQGELGTLDFDLNTGNLSLTGNSEGTSIGLDGRYLRLSDSSEMLNNYRHWVEGYLKAPDILGKLNISDTASMLNPYLRKAGWQPNQIFYGSPGGAVSQSSGFTYDGTTLNVGNAGFGATNYININGGRGQLAASGNGWQFTIGSTYPYDASKRYRFFNGNTEYLEIGSYDDGLLGNHFFNLKTGVDLIVNRMAGVGNRYGGFDANGKAIIMPTPVVGDPNAVLTTNISQTIDGFKTFINQVEWFEKLGGGFLGKLGQLSADGNGYAMVEFGNTSNSFTSILASNPLTGFRTNYLPNASGTFGIGVRVNGTTYNFNSSGVADLGTIASGGGNFNATITSPATGQMIRYNGSAWVNAAIQAADLPASITSNTSGTAANITATTNSTLTTLSALSLPVSQTTGTVPVNRGGTGAVSLTGILMGNGASAVTGVNTNVAGQILRRNLANNGFEWFTPPYLTAETDASALKIANNLSDVTNAATARTNLGLGNVNNTSDANKPISTATATALNTLIKSLNPLPDSSGLEIVWYNNTKDTFGLSISKDSILSALPSRTGVTGFLKNTNGVLTWEAVAGGSSFDATQSYNFTGFNSFSPSISISSGSATGLQIFPTINNSGTADYTGVLISAYQQATGSGTNRIFDVGTNTAADGTGTHTSRFRVESTGDVSISGRTFFANGNSAMGGGEVSFSNGVIIRGGGGANNYVRFGSTGRVLWNSDSFTNTGSNDLGIKRSSAGILEVNDGTAGSLAGLTLNTILASGAITANSFIKTGGLPTQYLMADGSTSTGSAASLQAVSDVGSETTNTLISNNSLDVRLPGAGVPHARLGFVASVDLSAIGGMLTLKSNKNGEFTGQGNMTYGGTTNAFFELIPGNESGTDTIATRADLRGLSTGVGSGYVTAAGNNDFIGTNSFSGLTNYLAGAETYHYQTADMTTNYMRLRSYWSGASEYTIGIQRAGSAPSSASIILNSTRFNNNGSITLGGGISSATNGTAQMSLTAGSYRLNTGRIILNSTNTAAGTTGDQTINQPSGTVNFAAGATNLTVTNSHVTANSIVTAVIRTNDATAIIKNVVPAAGSFTINLSAAATAETSVGFVVFN